MKSRLLLIAITIAVIVIFPRTVLSQDTHIGWSSFSMGYAAPASSNTIVKSIVGQSFVGSSSRSNNSVESGFLADTLLRGPVLSVRSDPSLIPSAYGLDQNYPNPFNPSTSFGFRVSPQGGGL